VRFLIVLAMIVGAGALAALAVRDGTAFPAYVAAALTLLAVLVTASGQRKRRAKRAAAAAAADAADRSAQESVRPAVIDQEVKAVADDTAAETSSDEAPKGQAISMDEEIAGAGVPDDSGRLREVPPVRTPFSVQPAVVLMSLYDAVAERFDTLSAHLWLEDASTSTLRLVAAFGSRVPSSDPVPLTDEILGACASTRTAVFAELDKDSALDVRQGTWRYAVPIGTPEVRGVAAVDIVIGDPAPAAVVLNEVSAVLRGSLTAALAVHVARSEMDTAVLLLQAAQELTSGMVGDDVLNASLERAMQVAGASTGSIMVPDGEHGALRIAVSRGLPSSVIATTSVSHGEGIAGTVYSTSAPLLVEDLPGRNGARRHGVLSSVSVPISDSEGSFGVINVGLRSFPARLTDAYVRALGILGAQTAAAIRNASAAERSWELYLENLQALAVALESDDPYRRGASQRTARLSTALGEELGLEGEDLISLRMAAILHDVGMGLATGSVGSTDRPLSTVDRGLVRAHPKVASDVLQQVPTLERLAPMVRHHHERFDGDGYDTGLSGASIPLGSRILAVVDAFVAMTSARPYRDALSAADALSELDAGAGAQFDPIVVDAFVGMLAKHPELADAI
jgi:HD-GYP domain-containing protein (c-di-GMP phosphodiesterase class II)